MTPHEKYPCALCVNDLHISKDNISEFQKNWDEVLDVCVNKGIGQIIVGGDLFQSRVGQTLAVLIAVYQALEKAHALNIEVTLAEGNHDKIDQEAIIGYCHIFGKHPNVYMVDDFSMIEFPEGLTIYVMSYFPESGTFTERLNEVIGQFSKGSYNILYCHEGINGGLSKPSDKELPANIFEPFDKVLVGHYHDRKQIPGTNIEYIGASRQHNFGEDAMKGYTIIYLDGSTEFIQNQVNTRYCTIEVESVEQAKEMLAKNQDGHTKVKMRITCSADNAATIDKDALLELGASKVEVVTETANSCAETANFDTKYDKAGLKEEYSRFCKQKEIEDIQLGLDYLDKII